MITVAEQDTRSRKTLSDRQKKFDVWKYCVW